MSNTKIRFLALKSNLITSSIIFLFFTTLSYFSRALYDTMGLSVPYKYIFLATLVLMVASSLSILLILTYITISEPFRSADETSDPLEYFCYLKDRLFHFTNPREYAKAIELGLR